jgi:threonine dehydrogenase-like Zn-dependent dehydrogenase
MRTLLACDGIAEVSGHPDVLEGLLNTVGVGRAVLMLGFPYGIISFNPESVVAQDLALVGSVGSGPADFRAALEILPSLRLDEFLTSTFPLANYADAWEAQREGEVLKVMLGVGS